MNRFHYEYSSLFENHKRKFCQHIALVQNFQQFSFTIPSEAAKKQECVSRNIFIIIQLIIPVIKSWDKSISSAVQN
jgi:hypothetical protein